MLRRGRAIRTLLHRRQFVSDRGRTRLYRQQQPVEGAHRVAGEARDRARGARRLPQGRTLSHRRWARRRLARAQSRRGDGRISDDPSRRRAAGSGDALFLGHDRTTERRAASAARSAARRAVVGARGALASLAISRRPDLPLACAALSLGAAGWGRRHDQARWDGCRHGAFRRAALPRTRRALSRHPHSACADHVLAHAETAGGRAPRL